MAIVGIGVDVAQVARFERLETRYGERFVSRVCHPLERRILDRLGRGRRAEFVAGRFACKEAAKKALGDFPGRGIGWKEIYIVNRATGQPEIHFEGRAAELAADRGVSVGHVSISHDGGLVIAQVILESV